VGQYRGVELDDLTISTERLVLRPWHADDADAIVAIMGGGALHRWLRLPDPYTRNDALAFVAGPGRAERAAGSGIECAVVERASGHLVGSAALRLPLGLRDADIGYWIAPSAQGRRYAAEVCTALAGWAYAHEVHRLEIRTDVRNVVSARVALRAGFAFEGIRRAALEAPDGRQDMAVFVRTSDDPGTPVAPVFTPLPGDGIGDGTLRLRAPVPEDIDGFAEQEEDELTRAMGFTGAAPPQEAMRRLLARGRLEWLVGPAAGVSMVDEASGDYAGAVRMRAGGLPGVIGLGYAVRPKYRGRGFATRALRLLVSWGFEHADIVRFELGVKVANVASQRAAVAAGFEQVGTARARLRNPDGTFSDEVRYARTNPRYG
jgi:RimJ/RimL family protein N-acetyltransferase